MCATVHPQTHDAFRVLYRAVKSSFYGGEEIHTDDFHLSSHTCNCRTQRALPDRNLILGHHNKSCCSCSSSFRSLVFLHGCALCCSNKSVRNVCSFTVGSKIFFGSQLLCRGSFCTRGTSVYLKQRGREKR